MYVQFDVVGDDFSAGTIAVVCNNDLNDGFRSWSDFRYNPPNHAVVVVFVRGLVARLRSFTARTE